MAALRPAPGRGRSSHDRPIRSSRNPSHEPNGSHRIAAPMCGIAGFLTYRVWPDARAVLQRMTRSLAHRGPDDEGLYFNESIGLGVRRLSVIDLETGQQPMSNEDGTVWVALNGEIYNFQARRVRLEGRGHKFRTQSDTEVVI